MALGRTAGILGENQRLSTCLQDTLGGLGLKVQQGTVEGVSNYDVVINTELDLASAHLGALKENSVYVDLRREQNPDLVSLTNSDNVLGVYLKGD